MDVIIVGAGVSGLISAIELSKSGANVTVLEEHEQIGVPSHCAGIVSYDYHEKIGMPLNPDLDLNLIYGLRFTNGSESVDVRARNPVARIISRKALDLHLSEIATENGSRIITSNEAMRITQDSRGVTVIDERDRRHEVDYVIVADGIAGKINRILWPNKTTGRIFPTAQSLARIKTDPSLATVLLSNEISPDFFAYMAPIDEQYARIGVASRKCDVVRSLQLAARKMGAMLVSKPNLWGVWIGGPVNNRKVGRAFGVGDAIGMAKATSGGGIVFGALSARLASRNVLSDWRGEYDKTAKDLERAVISEMRQMFLIRRLANSIGQDMLFEAIRHGMEPRRTSELIESIDFDFHGDPGRIVRAIRLTPFWLSFGFRGIKEFWRHHLNSHNGPNIEHDAKKHLVQ